MAAKTSLAISFLFVGLVWAFMVENVHSLCQEGTGLGGYRKMTSSEVDEYEGQIKDKLQKAVAVFNLKAKDKKNENEVVTSPPISVTKIEEVYSQVVAGTNYCIDFEMSDCFTSGKNPSCNNKLGATKKCEIKFYEPLPYLQRGSPNGGYEVKSLDCNPKK